MSSASLPFSSSRESTGSAILCGFATRRADEVGHLDVEMAIVGPSEPADHPLLSVEQRGLEPLALRAVRFPCSSILAARRPDPSNGLARVEKRQAACG
jgi:hypothetical protein